MSIKGMYMFTLIHYNTNERSVFMTTKPYCMEELTREEIDRLLQEGMQSLTAGNTYTAEEVDKILAEKFGI